MKVHRILPRDLEVAPSLQVAGQLLRRALEGQFLLTWYAEVEVSFLDRIFGGRHRSWAHRTVDTRRLAIELEGRTPTSASLSRTAERCPVAAPHEALDDALVTAQLLPRARLEARGPRPRHHEAPAPPHPGLSPTPNLNGRVKPVGGCGLRRPRRRPA